jgi:hypothetical protein
MQNSVSPSLDTGANLCCLPVLLAFLFRVGQSAPSRLGADWAHNTNTNV